MGASRWLAAALAMAVLVGSLSSPLATPPEQEACRARFAASPPPSWAPDLSQPRYEGVAKSDHLVPSPDGTKLHVRVYRPASAEGAPLPTVFLFSPYTAITFLYYQELEDLDVYDYAECEVPFFVPRGYNVVVGDMRGTHDSDGCFQLGTAKDTEDGVAIVDWIAKQTWSDQTVGMTGVSYLGMSQLLTAAGAPKALKAIIPNSAPTQHYRYLFMNGAKYVLNTATPAAYFSLVELPPPLNAGDENFVKNNLDTACGAPPYLAKTADFTGDNDDFWKARDYIPGVRSYRAAVLLVHGLEDENVKTDHIGVLWDALGHHGVARKGHFTQHGHSQPVTDWWNLTKLRWFDHWQRHIDTGMMDEPAVTLQRSDFTWRNTSDWPPPDVVPTPLWLARGKASFREPGHEGSARYTDIPDWPRARQRAIEGNHLAYVSAPLPAALRVTGPVRAELHASSDRADTNFAVLLYEEEPGGDVTFVTRGYLDARHRAGLDHGEDLVPGKAERFAWELYPRAHVFQPGSRLRVVVESSDFCTWLAPAEDCDSTGIHSDPTAATNTILEGPGLSRIVLPVEGPPAGLP